MNIGIMGGTFDPVHRGHLRVAEAARRQYNLAAVYFVPAGQPWQKTDRRVAPAAHRLEMVRLAIAGKPHFRLATLEIERAGPTYTIDTITELSRRLGGDNELYFIMGADSLASIPEWRDAPRLVRLCHLVVAPRPGYPPPDLSAIEAGLPGITGRALLMERPRLDISSTEIRDRLARGLSIHSLVPAAVGRYIERNRLYANG